MSESDLTDYPAPFFRGNEANGMTAVFPAVPAVEVPRHAYANDILLRENYIAKTAGRMG